MFMSVLKTSEVFFTFKKLYNAKMLKRFKNDWLKSANSDKSKKHLFRTSQTVKELLYSKTQGSKLFPFL